MKIKHVLLIMSIIAISVAVIPEVYSYFSGQHSFYNSDNAGCLKCHPDIRYDLDFSTHHLSFSCENCHIQTNSNLTHSSINPRCLDCHGTQQSIVIDKMGNSLVSPPASVFGENVPNKESHTSLVESASSTPLLKGENEACVACHTRKSLEIKINYADTYKFSANRLSDSTWQLTNYSKNTELTGTFLTLTNESAGQHSVPVASSIDCEKCHKNIRAELNKSTRHTSFSCKTCHQLYSTYHASSTPPCLTCHGTSPLTVTDELGNTFLAPIASVYADNPTGPDAHIPFIISAKNSNMPTEDNVACSSCHSSFNNDISFKRPDFLEWDVVDSSGTWTVQNLVYGPTIEVKVNKHMDGELHNLSSITNVNCISCHEDISTAVISGGHSNEQWKRKHNYAAYIDMNSYCKSCHKPITQDNLGTSPFPASPFNSNNHGAVSITCMDCHGKTGLISVVIDGSLQTPAYNSSSMGGIEVSIGQQPAFSQSYLCIACKNTGNPVPNTSLHFKLYTEPQVTIYVNGAQQYP